MSHTESIHRHQCPAIRALAQLSGGDLETLWWVLCQFVSFLTEDILQRTAICRFSVFSLACRACRSAGHAESV